MFAEWIALCALFAKHKVRYLIIGGNAVNFHGFERYTMDLDIWIEPTKANARRVYAAAREFGALPSSVSASDFADPNVFIVMGVEPYRIDLVMSPPGLEFSAAFANRVIDRRGKVSLSYVSRDDLILMKRAANRREDIRDCEMLETGKRIEDDPQLDPLKALEGAPGSRRVRRSARPKAKRRKPKARR